MSEESVTKALEAFKVAVEKTRDARFAYADRLVKRQRYSSYVVSMLSLYVIAISLIPNVLDIQSYQNQILLACSIVLSVFVIFYSLIDGAENFYHKADVLHRCGRSLATISHGLKNIDVRSDLDGAVKKLADFQDGYQRALDECTVNHDPVDFLHVKVAKPKLFPNEYTAGPFWIQRRWNAIKEVFMRFSWIIPPGCAILSITVIVYAFVLKDAQPIRTKDHDSASPVVKVENYAVKRP